MTDWLAVAVSFGAGLAIGWVLLFDYMKEGDRLTLAKYAKLAYDYLSRLIKEIDKK